MFILENYFIFCSPNIIRSNKSNVFCAPYTQCEPYIITDSLIDTLYDVLQLLGCELIANDYNFKWSYNKIL